MGFINSAVLWFVFSCLTHCSNKRKINATFDVLIRSILDLLFIEKVPLKNVLSVYWKFANYSLMPPVATSEKTYKVFCIVLKCCIFEISKLN